MVEFVDTQVRDTFHDGRDHYGIQVPAFLNFTGRGIGADIDSPSPSELEIDLNRRVLHRLLKVEQTQPASFLVLAGAERPVGDFHIAVLYGPAFR